MKKVLIGVGVLIAVLAIVVYVAFSSLDKIIKAAVEKYGSEITQATVTLNEVELSVSSGKGVLRGLSDPFDAIRYHSLAVVAETVPDVLEVTSHSDSGVIMGVRHREHPVEGIQFHPESILTADGKHILKNFLELNG